MAKSAKDWYAEKIEEFGMTENQRLLVINSTTNNISFDIVPAMQEEIRCGREPSPVYLAAHGHAATTYWRIWAGANGQLASDIKEFESLALGWFTNKSRRDDFTKAVTALRTGFDEVLEADRAITRAYNAAMIKDLDGAQDLAKCADDWAKEGKKDIDGALGILGTTLLGAVSKTAKAPPADPLAPLNPEVPDDHMAEFAERLAYFRLLKEQRRENVRLNRNDVKIRINHYPDDLAPPCSEETPQILIRSTADARESLTKFAKELADRSTSDITDFTTNATGWFIEDPQSQTFASALTSMEKGFAKFTEADNKLTEAHSALESEIAPMAKTFPETERLIQEADAPANEGPTLVEEALSALWRLLKNHPLAP